MNRALTRRIVLALALAAASSLPARATSAEPELNAGPLDAVVVTATRSAESRARVPASIDRLGPPELGDGKLQVNLSESLNALAGVSAQNRQNYAQDLQLSVRGFGARASFGVRGVRLYTDGIPGTMPDGQGQFSHFDLGSAGRIEVLRGPFSALYGNSSGGVIALFTEDAPPGNAIGVSLDYGSFDTQRYAFKASGHPGGADAVIDLSHFSTSGYRDHSAARRDNFNGKLRWQWGERTRFTLIGNAIDSPNAQDALGLMRAQLAADPRQAGVNALAYNTRKSINQEQVGAQLDHQFAGGDELALMFYGGQRHTTQFQSIPRAVQLASANHPGGVIDLERNYRGVDVRWSAVRSGAHGEFRLTAGLDYDGLDEARRGYLSFAGAELGVRGDLRRAEANRVYDFDQYLQAQWDGNGRWLALAGLRNSRVDVRSRNHLANPPGAVSRLRFAALSPVAGLSLRATPHLNLYGSYGRGFESPTLNELAYRSSNGAVVPGLNDGLRASRSHNVELGLKAATQRQGLTLALFGTRAYDELATQSSSFGRTVYQNIPQTERRGLELQWSAHWGGGWKLRTAYTYLDATVAESYLGSSGTVNAGLQLPAVSRQTWYGAVGHDRLPAGLSFDLELLDRSRLYVNDLNSDSADGYFLANLHVEHTHESVRWRMTESLRIDNLFDRRYVGTVIVNDSNTRYFEPSPGRAVYLLVRVGRGR